MTFRGIKRDYLVTLRGKRRPPWAPLERNLITVPGMPGAYTESTTTKPRPLGIPILLESKNLSDLQKMKEDLAEWLVTDGPEELIFDDEPDRVYYAQLDGATDIDEIISVGVGMLNFICPDPYKYSVIKSTESVTNPIDPIVLTNNGTVETAPTFDVTLKGPTTYLDIVGQNDYMRIGKPSALESTPVEPRQLILRDQMNTLTGWTKAQSSDIDGGTIAGNMTSNGYSVTQTDFGTGTSWHGDARIKSLGQSLTDFEVEFNIILLNDQAKTVGRIELYLLDEYKQVVGKLALKDNHTGRDGNYAEMRIGNLTSGKYLISQRGAAIDTWLNFDGLLRLSRVGNKWEAYVTKIINGKHTARLRVEYIDAGNQYSLPVAHVVMHMATNGTKPAAPMNIGDLKVYNRVEVDATQVEYIGEAGDVFTFDHKSEAIYKNGELFSKKDLGARFFPLYEGDNVLMIEPSESIEKFDSEWRDAYK